MTMQLNVDGLLLLFQANTRATKYNEWRYYRCRWRSNADDNIKPSTSSQLVRIVPVVLIEVKDYTKMEYGTDERPTAGDLADVVARKVFDTLAAMLPAKLNAADEEEKTMAASM